MASPSSHFWQLPLWLSRLLSGMHLKISALMVQLFFDFSSNLRLWLLSVGLYYPNNPAQSWALVPDEAKRVESIYRSRWSPPVVLSPPTSKVFGRATKYRELWDAGHVPSDEFLICDLNLSFGIYGQPASYIQCRKYTCIFIILLGPGSGLESFPYYARKEIVVHSMKEFMRALFFGFPLSLQSPWFLRCGTIGTLVGTIWGPSTPH